MNIQLFADVYDEMIQEAQERKQQTQNDINNLAIEKQNVLDNYEQTYQAQLNDYNNLMEQQQRNIDTWADTQKQTQQKQTDFNIGLIEQNKQEAQKQTDAEIGNAYIDYQKGLNQFGGSAETLASQGLGGTGFAKNQDIAMNITYQNRVSSAKSALQKANTDYNNQIQQALLNNDAALAEIALQQMQQSYALALQGFEYKSTMMTNRTNYIQSIGDTYFSRGNTLQNRLDSYTSNINSYRAAQEQERAQKEYQEAQLKAAQEQAQLKAQQEAQQLAWEREKFYTNLAAKYGSSSGGSSSGSRSSGSRSSGSRSSGSNNTTYTFDDTAPLPTATPTATNTNAVSNSSPFT